VARRADAHAVVDPRRDLDLQGLVLADTSHAIAIGAGIGDFLAGAVAGGAGLLHTEEALLHAHRPAAAAGVAGARRGAGLGARAMTGLAGFPAGDADLCVVPIGSLLQADLEIVFEVCAPIDLRPPAAAAPGAEDLAEDVAEGVG